MLSSISDPAVSAVLSDARAGRLSLFPSPDDWRDGWIYFLLVDRFHNPDKPPAHRPYKAAFSEFQGGTFRGVTEKLPYLKDLGVGALWLSPVLKNRPDDTHSYHGYGVQNFLEIEPRLASDPEHAEDELRELIAEAHKLGISVILDIVLHHAGDVFSYVADGKDFGELDWSEDVQPIRWRDGGVLPEELQRGDFWTRRGIAESAECGFHPNGDFSSLKAFDLDFTDADGRKPVWDILIQAHQYWIARLDIDGFRIDTLKFLSPQFAREFGRATKEFARSVGKDNFFVFGEVYDTEETIAAFVGRDPSDKNSPHGIDSVLDYPLFDVLPKLAKALPDAAPSSIAGVFEKRAEFLKDILKGHGSRGEYFVTFLDNHDQDSRFGNTGRAKRPDQIALGLALLFTLQGIPCVYYGTEQGLSGHKTRASMDDSHVREALWGKRGGFSPDTAIYWAIQGLSALRREHPALRCGEQFFRPVSGDGVHFGVSELPGGVLAYSRIVERDEVLVTANPSLTDTFTGEVVIDWTLSANGAVWRVLWSNLGDAPAPGVVAERMADCPVRVLPLTLRPGEVQILAPK